MAGGVEGSGSGSLAVSKASEDERLQWESEATEGRLLLGEGGPGGGELTP